MMIVIFSVVSLLIGVAIGVLISIIRAPKAGELNIVDTEDGQYLFLNVTNKKSFDKHKRLLFVKKHDSHN